MTGDSGGCARSVLEAVPAVMRFIRAEMRSRRKDLSVPQFRSLAYINRVGEASLGDVAGHLGLTAASTSKMVETLKRRGLLSRTRSAGDRRRVSLTLTPEGLSMMKAARAHAQEKIAAVLTTFPAHERAAVSRAMRVLSEAFVQRERTQ
jgi:DNA-binding MarR family transcriptional regulator